jgi:hypothetical protein
MGFVTIVMGTWKKNRRREIASQRRKGTTQPRSFSVEDETCDPPAYKRQRIIEWL